MFGKSKSEPEKKASVQETVVVSNTSGFRAVTTEPVSVLGRGMTVKGSIVCEGPMQIFGRVFGEIHGVKLSICEGAQVEGEITAEDATIAGHFKGTIHCKNVKLERTAVVEGEIFKNTLTIDQDAQFEGMTRKLEKTLDLPSKAQAFGDGAQGVADGASVAPRAFYEMQN